MSEAMDITVIEAQALALPIDARAALARRLLQSLEEVSEAEYERLWGEESARRGAEADNGRVQVIPGAEVARKARSLLR
ncbi:MAG: addiction module protein [Porticoccaceae bacterium]